jgi:hypothetical protein
MILDKDIPKSFDYFLNIIRDIKSFDENATHEYKKSDEVKSSRLIVTTKEDRQRMKTYFKSTYSDNISSVIIEDENTLTIYF